MRSPLAAPRCAADGGLTWTAGSDTGLVFQHDPDPVDGDHGAHGAGPGRRQ